MVVSRLISLDLNANETHEATDWQIATDEAFTNVIIDSVEDHVNKTIKYFPDVLDTTVEYYGRARLLLNTGYTEWGNLDIFIPKYINDTDIMTDLPTVVNTPIVTTNSPANAHTLAIFNIATSPFVTGGNATHESTTWVIEDVEGNVVYKKIRDKYHKTTLVVNDVLLKDSSLYRIKAYHHSSSDDTSYPGTLTIVTGSTTNTKIVSNINGLNVTVPNIVDVKYYPGTSSVTYEVYSISDNEVSLLLNGVTTSGTPGGVYTFTIPANTLVSGLIHIVRVRSDLDTTFETSIFTTY